MGIVNREEIYFLWAVWYYKKTGRITTLREYEEGSKREMKCPICGEELVRSKKDPEYMLCRNCKKRFKPRKKTDEKAERPGEERPRSKRPEAQRTGRERPAAARPAAARPEPRRPVYDAYEREEPSERFKTFRLITGIISVILFLLITLQSCAAGLGNILSANGEASGSAGFILALMMMVGGIVTICMRKKESVPAFIVPFIFYTVGALLGAANVGSYADLAIWSVLAAVFGALHLLFLFLCRDVNIILSILVPVLIVAAIVGFTVMSTKGSEEGGSTDAASGNQGASDEGAEDDGVINFNGSGYNITLTRTETGSDYEGNPCVYVYYTFTNTGEQNLSPAAVSYLQVFQNGVSCERAITSEINEQMNNYSNEVQPGGSSEACEVFSLTDTSDITVEVSDFLSASGEKDSQVIQLQ